MKKEIQTNQIEDVNENENEYLDTGTSVLSDYGTLYPTDDDIADEFNFLKPNSRNLY